jgi:hypothetical protein
MNVRLANSLSVSLQLRITLATIGRRLCLLYTYLPREPSKKCSQMIRVKSWIE